MNPKAMLGLSFVLVLISQLLVLGITLAVQHASSGVRLAVAIPEAAISLVLTATATGAAVVVVGEAVLGTRISIADALDRLRGRIWRLVGLGLLITLILIPAYLLLIIPGIYLTVLFLLATPAFVLERIGVRAAIRRSADLVRGAWWRTLGIGLLGGLVGTVISGIIQIPFLLFAAKSANLFTTTAGSANTDVSTGAQVLLAAGRIVGGTISTPIIAGTIALMYIDRRMRREGLDLVLAQTARERAGQS
jgi:hypothetical protein